jgi:hypothetical protein
MSAATPTRDISGVSTAQPEVCIYFHSPILYWWPLWAVGFLMAVWTALDNHHMVLVPDGSTIEAARVIAPEGGVVEAPLVHVARSRWPGLVFALTLLIVLYMSNASLRGVWGLFGIAALACLILLFNWLDWWSPVFRWFRVLRLYFNLGVYLFIAVPVFVAWMATVFLFDRRTYMIFSSGQVRIRDEVGEAEKVYDSGTLSFEKAPYDWLRFLCGFGAGDLQVRVGGPNPTYYQLPNVVRVGQKMVKIEERLRTKDVV